MAYIQHVPCLLPDMLPLHAGFTPGETSWTLMDSIMPTSGKGISPTKTLEKMDTLKPPR